MWPNFDQLPFLIAEDSDDDLVLLQRALSRAGISNPQITTATGAEAIDYLERAVAEEVPYPVILFLDLMMPRVDGIAVLEWLRDHPHAPLPVVLHTGAEDDALLQRASDLGASFYLPKGARSDAMREVCRRAREEWEQHHLLAN